jgi:hypothetical protein
MNKTKLTILFLVAIVFFGVLVVHAQSNRESQPRKVKQKEIPAIEEAQVNIPERSVFKGSLQGYRMIADVLDSFGGESESDNYRIPVNSGGQPSAIGISKSDTLAIKAGFAHAAWVRHGDAHADGVLDLGDVIHILNYLFKGGSDPCPMEAGDANRDGVVGLGDAILLLNYLFKGGPAPAC